MGKAEHPVVTNQCVMNLVIVYGLQENVAGKGSGYLIFLNTTLRSEFNCRAGTRMQYRSR